MCSTALRPFIRSWPCAPWADGMLARLKRRIPGARDDALLEDLIADAGRMICAYTQRPAVPQALEAAQLELAVMLFNRMGMEGESSHGEGSVTRTVDSLPEHLRRQLNPWRLAKAVSA